MAVDETFIDTIAENAAGPKEAEADGVRRSQHPIPDQIEFDKYRKANGGASLPARGIRITKLIPPGTV